MSPVDPAKVAALRRKQGLSQEGLAEKCKLHPNTIKNLEDPRARHAPTAATLECVAEALGVTIEELMSPAGHPVEPGAPGPGPAAVVSGLAADRPRVLPPREPALVGRDGLLADIKDRLRVGSGAPTGSVLIHGLPGIGKTAVADALALDRDIEAAFDVILWAQLGPKPEVSKWLERWGRAVGAAPQPGPAQLGIEITRRTKSRRLLLIIDDVWRPTDLTTFAVGSIQTPTVVTARRAEGLDDCRSFRPDFVHPLPVLEPDDAFRLLARHAPAAAESDAAACQGLVDVLGRLPLSIEVAGRMIARASDKHAARIAQLLKEPGQILGEPAPFVNEGVDEQQQRLTVDRLLGLSVDLLTPEQRLCFLAAGQLKAESEFGPTLLHGPCGPAAADVLRALADHGLVEYTDDGRYRMHALLAEYAKKHGPGAPP